MEVTFVQTVEEGSDGVITKNGNLRQLLSNSIIIMVMMRKTVLSWFGTSFIRRRRRRRFETNKQNDILKV